MKTNSHLMHLKPKMEKGPVFTILLLAISCCLVARADAEENYEAYKNPKKPINRRINDLLRRMSLEEKIGQMVQIERSAASYDVMKKYHIGP